MQDVWFVDGSMAPPHHYIDLSLPVNFLTVLLPAPKPHHKINLQSWFFRVIKLINKLTKCKTQKFNFRIWNLNLQICLVKFMTPAPLIQIIFYFESRSWTREPQKVRNMIAKLKTFQFSRLEFIIIYSSFQIWIVWNVDGAQQYNYPI